MPLKPPRPRLVGRRLTEHADPVVTAVPPELPAFLAVKDFLKGDDCHRLRVRPVAQRRGEQAVSCLPRIQAPQPQADSPAPAGPVLQPAQGPPTRRRSTVLRVRL